MDDFTHPNLQLIYNKQALSQRKSIKQYDLNNNFIKIWDSAVTAGHDLNISKDCILHCCSTPERYKTHGNYIWKYDDDPDLAGEIWIELTKDLSGLFVSNMGRYYSKKMNKSYGSNQNNYMRIHYKKKVYRLSRLILCAFIGEPPSNKHIAYHKDNNTTNNNINNLKWDIENVNTNFNRQNSSKTRSRSSFGF